ncbi:hypothetical protein [Dietzia sp. MNB45]|uniref:hypothetical protein n=1 Tax=Dietzia sp. MNB45 TaxID=3238800 RepID=UPI003F7F9843
MSSTSLLGLFYLVFFCVVVIGLSILMRPYVLRYQRWALKRELRQRIEIQEGYNRLADEAYDEYWDERD